MKDYISAYIRILTCKLNSSISQNSINLGHSQSFLILSLDKHNGELLQSEIEKLLKLRRSSVTSLIKPLEKDGYIERLESSKDKRIKIVKLTKKGYEICEVIKSQIDESEKKLISNLSEREIETLKSILIKCINNFERSTK